MNRTVITVVSGCIAVAAIAAGAGWYFTQEPAFETAGLPPVQGLGGAFTLVDGGGAAFGSEDLEGRGALVYFGYTYCPDVCPTELARVAQVTDQLAEAGIPMTPVFITVDPERDTTELVGDYVNLFHEDMVGLTGSTEQIAEIADDYGVFYNRVEEASASDYLMDHTSLIYLLDPTGRLVWTFRPTEAVDAITQTIRQAAG